MISSTEAATAERVALPVAFAERLLLVAAGGELFGLPLADCREILEARAYTRIPGAGSSVCGLINLRGRPVTVFDLGVSLGREPSIGQPEHGVLIIEHAGRRLGLAVDQVVRIVGVGGVAGMPNGPAARPIRLDDADLVGSGWGGAPMFTRLDPGSIFQPALG